jgi:ribonuclease R
MPDPKRIVDFEETASAFGYSLGLTNLPVKQMVLRADRRDARRNAGRGGSGQARKLQTHEVPEQIPVSPQMYQKLTAKIAGKPEERILSYLMLRSLKQAKYSEKNEGHFALASPCYTHFTSPIRRYPDLIVHRLVRALLESGADARGGAILSTDPQPWRDAVDRTVHGPGRRRERKAMHAAEDGRASRGGYEWEPIPEAELGAIAVESSQAERRADDAERELMEWKKMRFMEDRIGKDFSGIILSCTKYGFFVELDELFIEGLVPISTLGDWGNDERFVFRETDRAIVSTRTRKAFKIGQRVRVLLDRIDRQNRRLQFALVQSEMKQENAASKPRTEPAERGKRSKRSVAQDKAKRNAGRSGKKKGR